MDVKIYFTKGCPATPKTIDLIHECINEIGIKAEIASILITSQDEANDARFLGSPTIHINGIDIDHTARKANAFGFM